MKIVGVVPARMASSRFPGKPLFPICGRPMLEHAFRRAAKYPKWTSLHLATCDNEIADCGRTLGFSVIMTSDTHTRALERVSEAASKCGENLADNDVVVCVQADEPMLHPDMIAASMQPLFDDPKVPCTVLAMKIEDEAVYRDRNTLKIIHDLKGDVLYTSRSPIPHCDEYTKDLDAKRIYGIFAFRWHFLQTFLKLPPSPLELVESCDSNRIMDHGYRQRIAPYPCAPSYSVDAPSDAERVEAHMKADPLWGTY